MAFIADKEELKPGLVIFRRTDVAHRNWYCRVKLPKADRYKTISLKTADLTTARDRAFDHDADVRFRLKHNVPVFNRPFRDVAKEYIDVQEARAKRGEITDERASLVAHVINNTLDAYVGAIQIHLIGQDKWEGYPSWRRENGVGRFRDKIISDSTIRWEMAIFRAVIAYAAKKKYIDPSQTFEGKPALKIVKLHRRGTPYFHAIGTPLALRFSVARRRSAEPLAKRSA